MGDGASPDINQEIQNKDQIRKSKNADKSINARLKRGIRNVVLTGLALSPTVINDTNISVLKIKEPTPSSAPKLQPPAETPMLKSTSEPTLSPKPTTAELSKPLEQQQNKLPTTLRSGF
jgi:hypothetical protein